MSKPIDQEREAFEAAIAKAWPDAPFRCIRDLLPPDDPKFGEYVNVELQGAWIGWQARDQRPPSVAVPVMQFQMKHPSSGESHIVELTRAEVADGMEDLFYEKLSDLVCGCGGEADHECGDYIYDFDLQAVAPHPVSGEQTDAARDVLAERERQVSVEGFHGFRDSHYLSYELSKAARAYIEVSWHALSNGPPCKQPDSWPWRSGFKWSDGRTMLVKASALILAEIERLDRAARRAQQGEQP